ncbi:ATP-binding protein [Piscinibacter sp. XHJ-5]|uniref:ATP-binding protein n=1 Tax=Piscinibacter sp. XHJ-5 TaxID=3037797 RepID=UPI00245332B5|nr:ATP-binding protein [Piscinibacter sp. XHJ-5]
MTAHGADRQGEVRRRWIIGAMALFITAMIVSAAHDLWTSRREAERQAEQEIVVLARVLAEQTRRSLQTVDVMLREIADAHRADQLPAVGSRPMDDYLEVQRSQERDVLSVFLAGPDGRRLAGSGDAADTPDSLARWPGFDRLKTDAALTTLVEPVARSSPEGRWSLPMLRRMAARNGRFDGCVGAMLDTSYFERFYAETGLGEGHVLALVGGDGSLVARHPRRDGAVGQPVGGWAQGRRASDSMAAPRRFFSRQDRVERLGVSQPVPGYPLHVLVARDTDLVFASWREAAWGSVLRTALLCAAALGLLAVVLRQLKRLETARASLTESAQQLRVSEERYALAVAGANEGLWDWDLATDRVFFSARAQQACGIPPGESMRARRDWIALLPYHPDDRPRVRDALVAHLRGRSPHYDVEMRIAVGEGTPDPDAPDRWNWVRQRGLLVRDESGRPRRMAGSIEDITGRKRAEVQQQQLEVRLRTAQKLEAMGTLAGGIAHDFNNILGAILGYAELAHGEVEPGSALQHQLEGVMNAGLRAKSLVQRILAFSRSGMGEKLPVHVQAVVEEALDLLAASLPAGVTLQRDLRAGDAALVGDPAQIHQVVMNLGANALQASRSPGVVSVTLAPLTLDAPRHATSGDLPAGEYLELVVCDQGTGIEASQIERIFDPFYTTKAVGVGTGLGLSLVHGIVAELRGAIDVRSEPGRGSTFTVLLPWHGAVTSDPRLSSPQEQLPRGNGERVLLVDDEAALVALGEETLAALGYEPVGYTSSVEALQAFEQDPLHFDAVLSDETMPQLTGSQLAAAVRRARPDLPVLLMTGYVSPALAARARELGVREVLAKPLVARDIARALAGVLQAG